MKRGDFMPFKDKLATIIEEGIGVGSLAIGLTWLQAGRLLEGIVAVIVALIFYYLEHYTGEE